MEHLASPDGLGDTNPQLPKIKKIEKTAVDFLIEKTKEFPNEITILALGPLTNIAGVSSLFIEIEFRAFLFSCIKQSYHNVHILLFLCVGHAKGQVIRIQFKEAFCAWWILFRRW